MKKLVNLLVLALTLGIGGWILSIASNDTANRDVISYWSAGKQLIHHQNPYDGQQILALERGAGSSDVRPFFMRNPPTAFLLSLPLAAFSAKTAGAIWSIAIIAALMGSIRLLWMMNGSPKDSLHLLGYLFPPALACLLAGQIGIFLLLGVTLFLYFIKDRPFIAGAALGICALKPHLFVPFGIVLLISSRKKVLYGAAAAIAILLVSAYAIDPHGWSQYRQMIAAERLSDELIPTVSLLFRLLIHRGWMWLQFVPLVLGTLWAVRYFAAEYEEWDWSNQGLVVLLVSVLVSPYAWFTDEAVLLPAILFTLYRNSNAGRSLLPYACIAGVALIEVLAGVGINTPYYLWTAPAWLILCLQANQAGNHVASGVRQGI